MGREIRKVPAGWEHPRDPRGNYLSLYDDDYTTVADEWLRNCQLWADQEHPDQLGENPVDCKYFWEWEDSPPSKESYRPKWTDEERTHIQIYETVSEGSPASPVFATPEEMVEYLVEGGDEWDRLEGRGGRNRESAENFVKLGFSFSMTVGPQGVKDGIDATGMAV